MLLRITRVTGNRCRDENFRKKKLVKRYDFHVSRESNRFYSSERSWKRELIGNGQRWQIARRLLTTNYGILPLLSRRNTRFRDNRRLTMTLPLVTIARSLSTAACNKDSLLLPPFLAPGDLSAPATDCFAIAISRWGITIASPSTSP